MRCGILHVNAGKIWMLLLLQEMSQSTNESREFRLAAINTTTTNNNKARYINRKCSPKSE